MGIVKYISQRFGNLGEVLFGIALLLICVLASIFFSIKIADLIGKGHIEWNFIAYFIGLTFINALFVLGSLVVMRRSKDLLHIEKLEKESSKMEDITKKFFNGEREELLVEKGIIKCLDDLTHDFSLIHDKLLLYALATQFVHENVVIINSPTEGDHILKSFFRDDKLIKHINEITQIQFTGTGRGAVNGGNKSYNFYEPLTKFLSLAFCNSTTQLTDFKGIGSSRAEQQACFRAFMYRIVYFLLNEADFNHVCNKLDNFKITFIFPQHEVFPGQLTIGKVKSMFNVSLALDDAEQVVKTMPLALQVNSYGQDGSGNEFPMLPQTIQRIYESFEDRFTNYSGKKESWHFSKAGSNLKVTLNNINIDDLNIIKKFLPDAGRVDLDATITEFATYECKSFYKNSINDLENLKKVIIAFGKIGYGDNLPETLNL